MVGVVTMMVGIARRDRRSVRSLKTVGTGRAVRRSGRVAIVMIVRPVLVAVVVVAVGLRPGGLSGLVLEVVGLLVRRVAGRMAMIVRLVLVAVVVAAALRPSVRSARVVPGMTVRRSRVVVAGASLAEVGAGRRLLLAAGAVSSYSASDGRRSGGRRSARTLPSSASRPLPLDCNFTPSRLFPLLPALLGYSPQSAEPAPVGGV